MKYQPVITCEEDGEVVGTIHLTFFDDVLAERKRQIAEEGWDADHDLSHSAAELLDASICYTMVAGAVIRGVPLERFAEPPDEWPWSREWWKPSKDPEVNMRKAMALMSAQYDVLQAQKSK